MQCSFGSSQVVNMSSLVTGDIYHSLSTIIPPKAFQFVTFTHDENKDAEYMCFGCENL